MYELIDESIGIKHFVIVSILLIPLFYSMFKIEYKYLYKFLYCSIFLNLGSYYSYLVYSNSFNSSIHLPFHLCYLTELCIILSLFFRSKRIYSWLILNSMLGGMVGFVNSNLIFGLHEIEYIHFYLSHFNLLIFVVIAYKSNIFISKSDIFNSIIANFFILLFIINFNFLFKSNYWFTFSKPSGLNLSVLFPAWPYYFLIFISIGFFSYFLTFLLLLNNRLNR